MIDLQHITKTYAKNRKKAVDDLTLHVEGGELFGFIGPNGAGKTTTIKLMTGVLRPDEGTVTMAGHRMDTERLEAQRLIGFVPDGNDLYDRLTGMEYLNFMADIYQVNPTQRKAHIEKYLDLFSLEDAVNNQIRSYSKGMKQKLVVILMGSMIGRNLGDEGDNLQQLLQQLPGVLVVAVLFGAICFMAEMNPALSTSVSREGRGHDFMLGLPVTVKTHLTAKLLVGYGLTLAGIGITAIAIGILVPTHWKEAAFFMTEGAGRFSDRCL